MSVTGRCLCGAVTFAAEEVQTHLHACHCAMCRKWTGGPKQAAEVGQVKFDGAEQFSLAGEIYIDEKPSGYAYAGEHPRMTGAEFMASMGLSED